jgi:WD40 repeat protein
MFVSDGEGGSIVAGLDSDGTVRFWDVTAADTSVLRRHTTIVSGVRWARGNPADIVVTSSLDGHGQTFGVAGSNITVRIWDADSGEQVASLPGKLGDMTGCEAVSDDGRFAAFSTGDYDATLQVWSDAASETSGAVLGRTDVMDLSTGEKVFSAPNYRIVDWLCFAADQRSIVLADKSTSIQEKKVQLHLLDGRTGEQLRTRSLDKKCLWTFARGPDGRFIAAFPSKLYGSTPADRPNTMLLIDTQTLETIRELDGIDDGQLAIGFSPDGERIVTGGFDGKLHVYNAQTGAPLATMSGHRDNVLAIAFSPDGRRIASGGLDRKVRIWDAKTYDQLAAFSGHEGHINTLEWQPLPATADHPAGDWRLFSSSGDSTARVWEPRPIRTRFEAREARKAALGRVEPMVTRLFEELKDASKVVERIKSDASLSPIDRKTALQVVLAKSLAAQAAVKH